MLLRVYFLAINALLVVAALWLLSTAVLQWSTRVALFLKSTSSPGIYIGTSVITPDNLMNGVENLLAIALTIMSFLGLLALWRGSLKYYMALTLGALVMLFPSLWSHSRLVLVWFETGSLEWASQTSETEAALFLVGVLAMFMWSISLQRWRLLLAQKGTHELVGGSVLRFATARTLQSGFVLVAPATLAILLPVLTSYARGALGGSVSQGSYELAILVVLLLSLLIYLTIYLRSRPTSNQPGDNQG